MSRVEILPLTLERILEVEVFFQKLPYHLTDWDASLSIDARARLARINVEKELTDGVGFVAIDSGNTVGVFMLTPSKWDTEYFGVKMGRVTIFCAPHIQAANALTKKLREQIRKMKFEHVYTVLDSRDKIASLALQNSGWHVVWASLRQICKPKSVDTSGFLTSHGSLELVKYEPSHLPKLIEIASRLTEYTWLQHEERLPIDRRLNYAVELTRNSCTTDFADVSLTLLDNGRPTGFNSSKLFQHPPEVGTTRYTYERNTFVDPNLQGKGYGKFLEQAVIKHLYPLVDYITGRVAAQSVGMLRMLESAGFKSYGCELYLVFES